MTKHDDIVSEMTSREDFLLEWYKQDDLIADPATGYAMLPAADSLLKFAARVAALYADGHVSKLDNVKACRARAFAELVRDESEAAIDLYRSRQ